MHAALIPRSCSSHAKYISRCVHPGRDREHRAEGVSGSLWSGESASVPSRVHVLPRIDDDVVFSTGQLPASGRLLHATLYKACCFDVCLIS